MSSSNRQPRTYSLASLAAHNDAGELDEETRPTKLPIAVSLLSDDAEQTAELSTLLAESPYQTFTIDVCEDPRQALANQLQPIPHCVLMALTRPQAIRDGFKNLRGIDGQLAAPLLVVVENDGLGRQAVAAGAHDAVVLAGLSGEVLARAITCAMQRQETSELRDRLEHAERMATLGELSAAIVHEVNNPAAFALANLSELRRRIEQLVERKLKPPPKSRGVSEDDLIDSALSAHIEQSSLADIYEMLDDCADGIQRIATIVNELGRLSQSSGSTELVALDDVARAAVRMLKNQIRVHCRLDLQLKPVPPVVGDRALLVQAVINVVDSVLRGLGQGHVDRYVLKICTDSSQGTSRIIIDDVRRRSSPAEVKSTARGGQSLSSLKPRLDLSGEYVRRFGGTLKIDVESDGGGRRTITLPWAPAPALTAEPQKADGALPAKHERSNRVLLIDDEPAVLRAFKRVLSRYYQVTTADSGLRALQLLRAGSEFDAIVCDLTMPDLDGEGLYEILRAERPELLTGFIFCSGGAFTEKSQDFVKRAQKPVLQKPVPPTTLIAIIDELRGVRQKSSRHG